MYDYEYDADGNRISRTQISTDAADDHTTLYSYDQRNRLIEVKDENNSGAVTQDIKYSYDVFDRMVEREDDTTSPFTFTDAAIEQFVYDGNNVVLEFDNGSLAKRFLNGPAVDMVLAQEDLSVSISAAGRVLWGLTDDQGSITAVVDNAGTVVDKIYYDSFGQIAHETDDTVQYLTGYTGLFRDRASGMDGTQTRWYDPASERWLTQDLLGLGPDSNPYRYVGNSPTTNVDPTGLANFWNPFTYGIESPGQGWSGFFNPFNSGLIDTGIGFGKGIYQGNKNNADAVANGITESAYRYRDTIRITTSIFTGERVQPLSALGKAFDNQELNVTQFYSDVEWNIATVGIKSEIDATIEWSSGNLSDNEYSGIMGSTGFAQLMGANGVASTRIGQTSITNLLRNGTRALPEQPPCPTLKPTSAPKTAEGPLFGQKRAGPTFGTKGRPPELAGRSIRDVAADLRAKTMSPTNYPLRRLNSLMDGSCRLIPVLLRHLVRQV